jgi:hypothetical protein
VAVKTIRAFEADNKDVVRKKVTVINVPIPFMSIFLMMTLFRDCVVN